MMLLTIRQIEVALAQGRLDEAAALLREPGVRAHRRGQELTSALVDALVARGRVHLDAGRASEAAADAALAKEWGGNQPMVTALAHDAAALLAAGQQQHDARAALANAAKQHAAAGDLSQAQAMVERCRELNEPIAPIADAVEHRRDRAAGAVARAHDALRAGALPLALDEFERAAAAHASRSDLASLRQTLLQQVTREVERELNAGRFDAVAALASRCGALGGDLGRLTPLLGAVSQCRAAAQAVEVGELDRAAVQLRRLHALLPDAAWLRDAIERVGRARDALDQLREGPLGAVMLLGESHHRAPQPAPASRILDTPGQPGHAPTLPPRFFLHVEGGQSVLVLTQPSIELGPISGSRACEVPLMLPADAPRVRIERMDDEHFLTCERAVKVNGQAATHSRRALLPGDRLELARRGVVKYLKPHPASASALLELVSVRMVRPDVRRVVLPGGPIIIGPGAAAHVQASHLSEPIVVQLREGRLWARAGLGNSPAAGVWIDPDDMTSVGQARILVTL